VYPTGCCSANSAVVVVVPSPARVAAFCRVAGARSAPSDGRWGGCELLDLGYGQAGRTQRRRVAAVTVPQTVLRRRVQRTVARGGARYFFLIKKVLLFLNVCLSRH
jgi:hypothetical protein